jgi:hypothetical protein
MRTKGAGSNKYYRLPEEQNNDRRTREPVTEISKSSMVQAGKDEMLQFLNLGINR